MSGGSVDRKVVYLKGGRKTSGARYMNSTSSSDEDEDDRQCLDPLEER